MLCSSERTGVFCCCFFSIFSSFFFFFFLFFFWPSATLAADDAGSLGLARGVKVKHVWVHGREVGLVPMIALSPCVWRASKTTHSVFNRLASRVYVLCLWVHATFLVMLGRNTSRKFLLFFVVVFLFLFFPFSFLTPACCIGDCVLPQGLRTTRHGRRRGLEGEG